MKKKYTIRLYRMHDLDLITFLETHSFNVVKAAYSALNAFCHGDHFIIKIPEKREGETLVLNRVYTRAITLDTEKDKDIIEMLDKIKDGCRNNFIKNILRLYLSYPLSELFLKDEEDISYFNDKFSVFRKGKREAAAGKITKKTKKTVSSKNNNNDIFNNAENSKSISSETAVEKPLSAEETAEKSSFSAPDIPVSDDPAAEGDTSSEDEITDIFSSFLN